MQNSCMLQAVPRTLGLHTVPKVFAGLDVAAFEAVVHRWLHEHSVGSDEAFAVDGKTLRGIRGEGIAGVHLDAAFTDARGVVVGQAQSPGKGQELVAGREVVRVLPLEGRILTLDALYAKGVSRRPSGAARLILRLGGVQSESAPIEGALCTYRSLRNDGTRSTSSPIHEPWRLPGWPRRHQRTGSDRGQR